MSFRPRTHDWGRLTSDEIAQTRDHDALVVIPVGATEQHAAHMGTDADIWFARSVSLLAAERVQDLPVVVAPGLAFGFSPHHVSHAGTISLRLDTYLSVLGDLARSVVESGFKRAIFVNGHGGNSAPLRAKIGELVTDGLPVGMVDYWVPGEPTWIPHLLGGLKRGGHACEQETALALALSRNDPAEVERLRRLAADLAPRLIQPWIAPHHADDPITAFGGGWPPIFQADDGGYYGDPAAATPENGEAILEIIVEALARYLAAFAATPLRLGVARDPSRPGISHPLGARP